MTNRDAWKRRRRKLYINACITFFLYGLSLQIYAPTEFFYFKDRMKLRDPEFYYGLSWGCLWGSGVIFASIGSYFHEKTNNIRQLMILTNILSVLGNFLYLLYYSPYIILLGQFFIGMSSSRIAPLFIEIATIYKNDGAAPKMYLASTLSVIGGCFGPSFTYAFQLVHLEINGWVPDVNNMVGLVMAILFAISAAISYFTLHNVSKEQNLKKEITEEKEKCLSEDEDGTRTFEDGDELRAIDELSFCRKYLITLRVLLQNKETIFLCWLSFFTSFTRATMLLLIPIKSAFYIDWTPVNIAAVFLASLFGGAIPMAMISTVLSKYVNDFFLLLIAMVTSILSLVAMLLVYYVSNKTFIAAMFYCSGFFANSSGTAFNIVTRLMLGRSAPHNIQATTEAVKNILVELAYMFAGFVTYISSHYMSEFQISVIVISTLCLGLLLVTHKVFMGLKALSIRT